MEQLSKSLADLDAAADELLKSQNADKEDEQDEVTPDEISDDADTPNTEDAEDDSEEEDAEDEDEKEVEKSCDGKGCIKKSVKKSEEMDEDEDAADDAEEEIDEEDDSEEDPDEEDVQKSLMDELESSDVIMQGIDQSEFLSAVVEVMAKSLTDVQYDILNQKRSSQAGVDVLAKSLQATLAANKALKSENEKLTRRISRLEKSMTQGFDRIMDSLDEISSQPVGMRKSLASVTVHDRDFNSSLNGMPARKGFDSLSKGEVLEILSSELYAGNSAVTSNDIISYESGAPLRNDLQRLVASKIN